MSAMVDKLMKTLEGKMFEYAVDKRQKLKFQEEVVESCKMNYCGMYGKTWMCPPGVGTLESLVEKYSKYDDFFVFTTKYDLEDSFDIEGMGKAREAHKKLEEEVYHALNGEEFALLSAGGCNICKKCTYPDNPCRFPERARPSMEACGINVLELSQDVGIHYINGENTVTYFSLILFNKRG